MSTNARRYSASTVPTRMHTKDLTVGDKLIRVVRRGTRFGELGQRTEHEVTVKKIMASRLVIEHENGHQSRVLVTNSKSWPSQNGEVETKLEGSSNSWNTEAFELFTLDDPTLLEDRAKFEVSAAAHKRKHDVLDATRAISNTLTVETAQAAVEALQKWLAEETTDVE